MENLKMNLDLNLTPHNKGGFYFLTNRINLLTILGAGILYPAAQSWRYTSDSRDICDGNIPIWENLFPIELKHYFEAEGIEAPVIIEFDPIIRELGASHGALLIQGGVVFSSPTPVSLIKKIHFRTSAELEDFELRTFEDIPLPKHLFSCGFKPEFCKDTLSVNFQPKMHSKEIFLDKKAGAVVAIADNLFATRANFELAKYLMECTLSDTNFFFSAEGLRNIDASVSLGCNSQNQSIADAWLLNNFLEIISDMYPEEGFDSNLVLEKIRQNSNSLDSSVSTIIATWCNYVKKLINADEEIRPLDDRKSIIQRGILLFLMRPSLDRLEKSHSSAIRPGKKVYLIGSFLAGYYAGATRIISPLKRSANQYFLFMECVYMLCSQEPILKNGEVLNKKFKAESDNETYAYLNSGNFQLGRWKLDVNETLKQIYHQVGRLGFNVKYDYEHEELVCEVLNPDSKSVNVRIGLLKPNMRGDDFIRFYSICEKGGKAKLLTKETAIKLLVKNSELDMFSKFAYSETHQALIVAIDQGVDTMDKDELVSHIEHVSLVARTY